MQLFFDLGEEGLAGANSLFIAEGQTQMVWPDMAERGEGAVVMLSSIAGLRENTVIGTYGLSKAAEAALARNLAVEWGPKGIRVNAIAPGLIKTDFAKALPEDRCV